MLTEQKADIEQRAASHGLTPSEYARRVLFEEKMPDIEDFMVVEEEPVPEVPPLSIRAPRIQIPEAHRTRPTPPQPHGNPKCACRECIKWRNQYLFGR